jgi:hypothetical protein
MVREADKAYSSWFDSNTADFKDMFVYNQAIKDALDALTRAKLDEVDPWKAIEKLFILRLRDNHPK